MWHRHHYQGIQTKDSLLRATEYRQMAGRAGRAGIDTQGEAILMANNANLGKQLLELMQASWAVSGLCLTAAKQCFRSLSVSRHSLQEVFFFFLLLSYSF